MTASVIHPDYNELLSPVFLIKQIVKKRTHQHVWVSVVSWLSIIDIQRKNVIIVKKEFSYLLKTKKVRKKYWVTRKEELKETQNESEKKSKNWQIKWEQGKDNHIERWSTF